MIQETGFEGKLMRNVEVTEQDLDKLEHTLVRGEIGEKAGLGCIFAHYQVEGIQFISGQMIRMK